MTATGRRRCRLLLLALLIGAISLAHYLDLEEASPLHIIFQELYFLPLLLAGLWFGRAGGLGAATIVTALYLPTVLWAPSWRAGHNLGNLLEIVLFIVVATLVGWLRDREQALTRQRCRAEHLAAVGQAVSCIAHDMKTPLVAAGGFIRQARRHLETPERAAARLDHARAQVERLEAMVADMLAYARPLELAIAPVAAGRLLEEALAEVREKARQRDVSLEVAPGCDTAALLACDHRRLHQALVNLLDNGIEASPAGATVRCSCQRAEEGIRIEVSDQGLGVEPAERQRILEPFVTGKRGGTGLGLAIVKKIVDAHGGRLTVDDADNGGARFTILLPPSPTNTATGEP